MRNKSIEKLKAKVGTRTDAEIEREERELAIISFSPGEMYAQITKEANKTTKALIAEQAPDPAEQGVFSFLPTKLTRISPFFPMSRREMKDHPFKGGLEWETSWGKITVESGNECLSVYDETVLLSLLALVGKHETDLLTITQYELCKTAHNKPGKAAYNSTWKSIERLAKTTLKIEVWVWKGRERKPVEEMIGSIVSWAKRDHTTKTGKVKIHLNLYFLEMFGEGFITNLDLKLRGKLRGDVSKSLYRFYQGQRNYNYRCHMLTLARAINLNMDMPNSEMRKRIRKGLKELRKVGYLKRWTFPKDIVSVWKSPKLKTIE